MAELKTPDLDKLRRFTLTIGMILLVYSLAGVKLQSPAQIRPLGIPLEISHPEYLPVGLILASLYAALRFWYYGVKRSHTPAFIQHAFINRVTVSYPAGQNVASINDVLRIFPPVFGKLPQIKFVSDSDSKTKHGVLEIPWQIKVACWLENADYLAPIWVNVIAVLAALLLVFTLWQSS